MHTGTVTGSQGKQVIYFRFFIRAERIERVLLSVVNIIIYERPTFLAPNKPLFVHCLSVQNMYMFCESAALKYRAYVILNVVFNEVRLKQCVERIHVVFHYCVTVLLFPFNHILFSGPLFQVCLVFPYFQTHIHSIVQVEEVVNHLDRLIEHAYSF